MEKNTTDTTLPVCLDARTARSVMGWSRAMTYRMLHCPEAGAFSIGDRLFFHRDRLLRWAEEQSNGTKEKGG